MTKTFCDRCGNEITEKNAGGAAMAQGFVVQEGKDTVHVLLNSGRMEYERGHWCKYCLIGVVNNADDRPKKK